MRQECDDRRMSDIAINEASQRIKCQIIQNDKFIHRVGIVHGKQHLFGLASIGIDLISQRKSTIDRHIQEKLVTTEPVVERKECVRFAGP